MYIEYIYTHIYIEMICFLNEDLSTSRLHLVCPRGESYIELEAMKMIMSLKSSEAGKVTHALSAGSIVSAGELLARLELKDPSKVGARIRGAMSYCDHHDH